MENTYGISVDNRYELFYIDDEATDPLEAVAVKKKVVKEKQPQKEVVRKGAAEKENKAATINKVQTRTVPPVTKAVVAPKATPEKPNRQTRDEKPAPKRDDLVEKKNRRNREQTERVVANGVADDKPRRRKFEGRGKREFDRQSGSDKTGVKAVDKREGGGAHNWGSHKQEVIDELAPKPHPAEFEGETRAETQETPEENTVNQSPNQEEETKELTLDEYKAMRAVKSKPPQYNLRKAGEGEDVNQWKSMVALEAKRSSADEDGDNDATSFQQRATRQKHILDIEFHFNDGRRTGQMGRGPRGGRARAPNNAPGGGRQMGRNRRNDGDERPQPRHTESSRSHFRDDGHLHAAPKVDDEKDFPSLGLMNTQVVRPVKAAAKIVPMYGKEEAK
uniref:Putative mrna binding protein n=1 Tax=Nyssomyia neivai TaxID=330878 RepID=A0A1L8DI17_9DIPT